MIDTNARTEKERVKYMNQAFEQKQTIEESLKQLEKMKQDQA